VVRLKRIAALPLLTFALSACATRYVPLVDPAAIHDRAKYEQDLSECAGIAESNVRSHGPATGTVGGALSGAGLGALLSWIFGGSAGTGAAAGAVVGGVGGAASGAAATTADYETIYRNCMIGRGWAVLR
jgi:outer membrane lipoprotein SlyB